jgi:hypothetical protein
MFPGGLTMSSGPTFATTGGEKAYVSGRWHVLGDWSLPPAACKVTEGSTLVVDGTFDKGNKLSVLSGAVLRAANYTHGSSSEPRVLWDNRGEFIVTNELAWTIETISTTTQYTFNMFNYATADAVTKARAVVHNASTHGDATFRLSNGSDSVTNRIVVGEGGISFRDNHRRRKTCVPFFDIAAGKAVELGAYADWTFGTNGLFIVSTNLVLGTGSAVFFDTTDSETPSLGRTITVEGAIAGDGAVVVKGRGKLALNGAGSSFSGGLTVKDTATLAVGQSSTAGVGDVSMERGTTMELSYGETLDIGGAFTVAGGSGTVQIRLGPNAAAPVNGRIKLLSATSIDFGGAAPSDVFALANATFGSAVATFSVESNGTELWLNAPVSRFNEGDKVGLAKCVTLTQAQADWLNGFDDFDAMNTALAEVAADCFMEAFLLNLDVRETGWRSWTFVHTEITATPVDGGIRSVKVVATLTRGHSPKTGKNAPINGTVKLCSVDLATGQLTVVPGAVADDPKFANGDAATFEFESRDEGCCYRAIIE